MVGGMVGGVVGGMVGGMLTQFDIVIRYYSLKPPTKLHKAKAGGDHCNGSTGQVIRSVP